MTRRDWVMSAALLAVVIIWVVTLAQLLDLRADVREACGGVVASLDLTESVDLCR